METGSRQENASKQESRARSDSIGTEKALSGEACAYLPNNRSTSQPSSPAAGSGRAFGLGGGPEVLAGGGRYPPPCGTGADGLDTDGLATDGLDTDVLGATLACDAVWNRFDMKPPR